MGKNNQEGPKLKMTDDQKMIVPSEETINGKRGGNPDVKNPGNEDVASSTIPYPSSKVVK